jgi:hypothetical protein
VQSSLQQDLTQLANVYTMVLISSNVCIWCSAHLLACGVLEDLLEGSRHASPDVVGQLCSPRNCFMLLCDSLDAIRAVWLVMCKREEGGQHVLVQGLHVHSCLRTRNHKCEPSCFTFSDPSSDAGEHTLLRSAVACWYTPQTDFLTSSSSLPLEAKRFTWGRNSSR